MEEKRSDKQQHQDNDDNNRYATELPNKENMKETMLYENAQNDKNIYP